MLTPVAIACSGLGHVRRGNETWARDVAQALHEAGLAVTLFGGGPAPETSVPYVRIPHLRRDFPFWRTWMPWPRRYLAEQLSFLPALRRRLVRGGWQIAHLCDPDLALQLHRRTRGSGLQVVFKDGMRLGPQWCRRLDFVQVLAPYYRDVVAREAGVETAGWFVIPHLVDANAFRPPVDRRLSRAAFPEWQIPPDAFVVLGVGDFSPEGHKRLDWLVREVAALPKTVPAILVLAGQSDPDGFPRFETLARRTLGPRVRLLTDVPRDRIRGLFEAADVFAHAAVREPFGIVFLEAMASGLAVAGHPWEVTRWILGDAGVAVDMTRPGALSGQLEFWASHTQERAALGDLARQRVLDHFVAARVVPRYRDLYAAMAMAASRAGDHRRT